MFWMTASLLRPIMNLFLSKKWIDTEKLPAGRGIIVCPNHCTEIDPIIVGHMLYNKRFPPHFLAKASLFRIPVVKQVLSGARQIPVDRDGPGGGRSLQTAQAVLDDGGAIVIYPEGTLTPDPELWPMKGRTGAARLALKTGTPVIPVAHWGGQELFPRYAKMFRPFPRKRVRVIVGDPVDLSAFRDKPLTRELLHDATEAILADITALLAGLRGEKPPAERWDPAQHQQSNHGRDMDQGHAPGAAQEPGDHRPNGASEGKP
ncbi:lysophospholipid acyltransferase family protein [Acaricomes phytoseiuli]|uniref:lysophospholipid acyltransferase family protein n=1 Tax=Acaricomes phytoseiuli TaxID=291968 RepID=UPI00036B4821|nr:lysophospholipid acyltransferase family protein [Acaricomes phytoseiuli]